MRRRVGGVLVTLGTFGWAATQWYLVWLFARLGGGPTAVGRYSAVLAIATPVFVVAQFGLRTVYLTLSSEFAWRTYLGLRSIGVALGASVVCFVVSLDSQVPRELTAAIVVSKCADSGLDLFQGRIQRQGRLTILGILSVANSVGTILAATATVFITGSAVAGVLSSAAVSSAVCVCAWRAGRTEQNDSAERAGGRKVILASGFPVMVSQGLASFASYLPVVVLTRIAAPTVVGVFASAAYLLTFANLVGSTTQTILLTPLRVIKEDEGPLSLLRRARAVAFWMAILGAIATATVAALGGRVLQLIYGNAFWLPPFQLALLGLAAASIPPAFMFSAVLSVLNEFRVEVWIWLVACAVGVVVGVVMALLDLPAIGAGLGVAASVYYARLIGVVACAHSAARSRVKLRRGEFGFGGE